MCVGPENKFNNHLIGIIFIFKHDMYKIVSQHYSFDDFLNDII